ncbi:pyruvate:ferredoxin (flavodoxin) oxidoreductase [Bauldia litoralis]|uniref:pyruvate:ferredoxin (flavodoxin) oxidoreductase n=1 Tax=Bauldia litoralis TaxID=665467 RepID=UPI003263F97C
MSAIANTPVTDTMDGNAAVAHVAYRVNEVFAIYPITPSSPMAEHADEWIARGITNVWGTLPSVQEMQSEGGAAGALHGSLQSGALTTTFTASQGLLLMLPNMFKIAGELTPTVFHVAARSLATQALSIFGDHQDVMAVRSTGFAMLGAASVQEAHDLALVAQAATLESRIPFLHFMDGFRTSHEVNKLTLLPDDTMRAMIDEKLIRAHRERALSPAHPVVRGTAHNPDTFFQARETATPFHAAVPVIVQAAMDRLAGLCGRQYRLFQYDGHPEAERVVIAMGSGAEVVRETAVRLAADGKKVGALQVLLYRPFSVEHFLAALPATVRSIAVLDRCKEPGGTGEPLYQDVVAALAQAVANGERTAMPRIFGGRYGLSSKDFHPGMVRAVFDEAAKDKPRNGFTIGIDDDVSGTSLPFDRDFDIEPDATTRALFFGLGSDGTVGANKNSVKMLAEDADRFAQGYFVYDSHKSGAETVSHLRFGHEPVHAPYLIRHADFVACHRFELLRKLDILGPAQPGATFLLNAPYTANAVWDHLPRPVQRHIIEKQLRVFVIDATKVAQDLGLGPRVNTILQTCFFAISDIMPRDEAIAAIKASIEKAYGRKGGAVIEKNFAAVDAALAHLHEVTIPVDLTGTDNPPLVPDDAPDFVRTVTGAMMAGRGDAIPVSALPVDGTFPVGTTAFEKRNIAVEVPFWDADLCIQCGQCGIVCPHSVIRAKTYAEDALGTAPDRFRSAPVNARGFPDSRFSLQIYVEDCTGCGICVENCPAISPTDPDHRAIDMVDKRPLVETERENIAFFETLPQVDRSRVNFANVRGVQFLEPLFEFSGACAGCGETPYVKLISQLFGDRLQIANATGCSSIYGGNLPAHPWRAGADGRGPAWNNSLFEDNAEFGLGYRLAIDKQTEVARHLLAELATDIGDDLVTAILKAPQVTESELAAQRTRVAAMREKLAGRIDDIALNLLALADFLVRRSVWIVGGDGWAYDIGYGGLDHTLAQNRDVNVLVLDTEVYSNTGGQSSKATPLGATAKFASAGKEVPRKDLAMQAIAYGYVYVAQIAMGANSEQALLALREAEAYPGPSLVLAYSHCIAHGFDLRFGMKQQARATAAGYWPLFRYDPTRRRSGENPFRLDSPRPRVKLADFAYRELRYKTLARSDRERADHLMRQAQAVVDERYRTYEDLAARDGSRFQPNWTEV